MAFSDHKIAAFTHKITDLPDQPNLPADELKARFDSSPEELRVAHNALCDDADRLDDRVSGIIAETFGDTISKSMLSDELADELDAKAVETSVASRINALDTRVDTLETTVPQKCECFFGTYTGTGPANRNITVTDDTKAVILHDTSTRDTYVGVRGASNGLVRLSGDKISMGSQLTNTSNHVYFYICLCY